MAYSSSPSTFLYPPNQHFNFNDTYDPSTGGWLFENPFTPGQPVARANTTFSGSVMLGQGKGSGTINMTELGTGFGGSDGGFHNGISQGTIGSEGDVEMDSNYPVRPPNNLQSHRYDFPSYTSIGEYNPSTTLLSNPPSGSLHPTMIAPSSWDSRGEMALSIPNEQGMMDITLADGTPVNPGFPMTSLYTGARYSQLLQAKLNGSPSLSGTPSIQSMPDDSRSRTSTMTISSNVQAGFAMGPYGTSANNSAPSNWLTSSLTPTIKAHPTSHTQSLEPTLGSTLLTNEPLSSYPDLATPSTSTSPLPTSASARLLLHKQQQQQQQHSTSIYRSVSPVPPPSYNPSEQVSQVQQVPVAPPRFVSYRPDETGGPSYPLTSSNFLGVPQLNAPQNDSQSRQLQASSSNWPEMPRLLSIQPTLPREWERANNAQNSQSLSWPFQRSLPPPPPAQNYSTQPLQSLYSPLVPYNNQNPYLTPYSSQISVPPASPPKHQHSWNTVPPSHLGSAALSAIETSESSSGRTETRVLSDSPPDMSHPPSPPALPRASSGPSVKTQEVSPPRKRRRTQPSQGVSGKMSGSWEGESFDRKKAFKAETSAQEVEPRLGPGRKKAELDMDGEPKVIIACHNCRAKKLKCDGARPRCHHCSRRDHDVCSYDVVLKRRGPGRKRRDKMTAAAQASDVEKKETTPEKARPGIGVGSGRVKSGLDGLGCRFGVSTERG